MRDSTSFRRALRTGRQSVRTSLVIGGESWKNEGRERNPPKGIQLPMHARILFICAGVSALLIGAFPRCQMAWGADGRGKQTYIVLTTAKSGQPYYAVAKKLAKHRKAKKVISINPKYLPQVIQGLKKYRPDVVAVVRGRVESEDVILEGEAVAIGKGGKPLPFQDLMRRFRRVHDVLEMVERIPLRLHIFDVLYLDGDLLTDEPYSRRRELLEKVCPADLLVPRLVSGDIEVVRSFMDDAIKAGHEGLMAKRLDSQYTPGVRGKRWFKLKPAETLDLVVAAADWGYGRRTGWLSNYHLAAREGDEYLVIGKTFKGLTDNEFRWITERLQRLKVRETRGTVHVRPELVVEVAFNEIQRSSHYKSGFALRFARITRIREDKALDEADSLERVRELYEKQFRYKAKADF